MSPAWAAQGEERFVSVFTPAGAGPDLLQWAQSEGNILHMPAEAYCPVRLYSLYTNIQHGLTVISLPMSPGLLGAVQQ